MPREGQELDPYVDIEHDGRAARAQETAMHHATADHGALDLSHLQPQANDEARSARLHVSPARSALGAYGPRRHTPDRSLITQTQKLSPFHMQRRRSNIDLIIKRTAPQKKMGHQ